MNFKHVTAAAVLFLALTPAFAGNWYVMGAVGQSQDKDSNKGRIDASLIAAGVTGLSSTLNDKDTGYKLQLGYRFTPNWAIEGGYVDLGKFKYNATFTGGAANANAKVNGWNIAGVGTLPLNDRFSLFGELGFIDAKVAIDVNAIGPGGTASRSVSSTNWKAHWGFGGTYHVSPSLGIRAGWERFNKLGNTGTTGESDVNLLSVGVVFGF